MKAATAIISLHLLYQQAFSTMTIIKDLKFERPLMIGKFQFVLASVQKQSTNGVFEAVILCQAGWFESSVLSLQCEGHLPRSEITVTPRVTWDHNMKLNLKINNYCH